MFLKNKLDKGDPWTNGADFVFDTQSQAARKADLTDSQMAFKVFCQTAKPGVLLINTFSVHSRPW